MDYFFTDPQIPEGSTSFDIVGPLRLATTRLGIRQFFAGTSARRSRWGRARLRSMRRVQEKRGAGVADRSSLAGRPDR
eukprot:15266665-Alexandrium_andersonii.AAC.1